MEGAVPATDPERANYEAGWVAVHRMIREGMSWSGRERKVAFLNLGGGSFAQVSSVLGLSFPDDGRAVAAVDWDFDGDTDLWFANRTAPRVRLMRNELPAAPEGAGFLGLRLIGLGVRDAIGARVEVELGGDQPRRLIQTLRAGEGYLSQSSKVLLFGLGAGPELASLSVRWPDGTLERFSGAHPRRWFTLRQGAGHVEDWSVPKSTVPLTPAPPVLAPASSVAHVALAARVPLPELEFTDLAGAPFNLAQPAEGAEPFAVLLWASWCAPCVAELRELSQARAAVERTGVRLVAVNVDEARDRPKAAKLLADLGWPFASLYADADAVDAFDVLQQSLVERRRRLALPTSFLVDRKGLVGFVNRGPLSLERLASQARDLDLEGAAIRDRSAPFPGRWVSEVPLPPYSTLEARFRERGHAAIADFYQRMTWQRVQTSPAQLHYKIGIVRQGQGRADLARAEFERALLLEPEFQEARIALAYMLQQAGDHAGAAEAYGIALRHLPRHGAALQNVILSLVALEKFDAAAERLAQLRDVDAPSAERLEPYLEQKRR
jgi:thiol-disulfide isomerase/thioredoxin